MRDLKKHFWLWIAMVLLHVVCLGQTIQHHKYTVYWNTKYRCPDSISWDLTPSMVNCGKVTRINAFAADPLLPNSPKPSDFIQLPAYKTDKTVEGAKGHNFSFEDAACSPIDKKECFYMSNMYWQYQIFNEGDWKTVEAYERQLAAKSAIHIISGYIDIAQTLPTGIPIVRYMYKAIYSDGHWCTWIMPNLPTTKGHKYDYWIVPISELDAKTGLKL